MLLAQRQSKVAPQFVLHISSPYTFPSLQITEACFMGGGYSQLTPSLNIHLTLVGMVYMGLDLYIIKI